MSMTGKGIREPFDKIADFIANSAINIEGLFGRFGGFRKPGRIVEADVNRFGLSGENRAFLISVVANGNNIIKIDIFELCEMLRLVPRNINAGLSHNLDGVGVKAVNLDTC